MYVLFMCLRARIQIFWSEGVQLWQRIFVFFYEGRVDGWRADPNTAISGTSTARLLNAIEMAFAGGPMLAQHPMLAWFLGYPDQYY